MQRLFYRTYAFKLYTLIFVYMPKYVMMSPKKVIVAIPYESHVT